MVRHRFATCWHALAFVAQQIWRRVDRSAGLAACWPWLAASRDGYGRVHVEGRLMNAHGLVMRLSGVAVPEGLTILHRCDNPPCCNPAHLYVGTQQENVRDMREQLRALHRGGRRPEEIATMFGLSTRHTRRVLGGSWRTAAHLLRPNEEHQPARPKMGDCSC